MTQCAEVISTLVISKQLWCRCFEPSLSPSSNISAHWSYGNYSHYPSWASLTNFFTVYQTPQSSLLMMVTARAKQQQRKCCQQLGTPFQLLPADWERIYCKWYFCCWIQCLVWKATFSKWKWQCPCVCRRTDNGRADRHRQSSLSHCGTIQFVATEVFQVYVDGILLHNALKNQRQ